MTITYIWLSPDTMIGNILIILLMYLPHLHVIKQKGCGVICLFYVLHTEYMTDYGIVYATMDLSNTIENNCHFQTVGSMD
jgi:hypothetical protein